MALSTYTSVFYQILDERQYFDTDSDRAITEMAESLCPTYTADIIAEWAELPSEHSDVWQDNPFGWDSGETSIVALMSVDLAYYYNGLVRRAWAEVQATHTCEASLPNGVEISPSGTMATCAFCDFKSALWECACELEHDCEEED